MMLPASCQVVDVVRPATSTSLAHTSSWTSTDVTSSFTLSKQTYVIIMYQYTGVGNNRFIVMRLSIDKVAQKTTVSLMGNTYYVGNFGLWQGYLGTGSHTVSLEYRSDTSTVNYVSSDLEWERFNRWQSRSLTVITC